MTQLDSELQNLKSDLIAMFQLVHSQLDKAYRALRTLDEDLAHEVRANERRINGYELKLDRDCESLLALLRPVAADLRFVIAALKINSNLERIGDIADWIARFALAIKDNPEKLEPDVKLLESTKVLEMYDIALWMVDTVKTAFEEENSKLARKVFKKDDQLDEINLAANEAIAKYIKKNPEAIDQALYILSIIRKLERVGDQVKNIAEEINFSIEAKILKHGTKKINKAPEL